MLPFPIAKDLKVNRDKRNWNMNLIMLAPVDQTAHRMRSRERHFDCSENARFWKILILLKMSQVMLSLFWPHRGWDPRDDIWKKIFE